MFEITADEIAQLDDKSMRELVGLLCEAELFAKGLSPSAVTYGGNQRASDGGLDVRVALPIGTVVEGFIPRQSVGFQVKTPDMPRAEILAEMQPKGVLRPAIEALVAEAGAYIIASSHGSTSDTALSNRRDAMREAVKGNPNASDLLTDFYDRTRLASWVRLYPGLIAWVKARAGRAVAGWQPYGSWAGGDDPEAEYLLDEHLRVRWGGKRHSTTETALAAIDQIRDQLRSPRQILRLVGLSGVGKTRFAQALFDQRIGERALGKATAIYTNLSDNPDPQPIGLASDLIANGKRAVLIVDNCPPELHGRLAEFCSKAESTVSVLTIEYDVRDDLPEGTQVISLEPSSNELIGRLIAQRFPHISHVDARTIAEASGGNARIAIAIAGTVKQSETLAGLTNEGLFQRLFQQRNPLDNGLLQSARACALLYSFQGQALDGPEAELPALASLAGQTATELYRNITELMRRDLVQSRSVWRALLPHAISNRLAAHALEDIPPNLIEATLIRGGSDRMARSFSRRLAYLHDHPVAIEIVHTWLMPGGLFGTISKLNDLGHAMFRNIAPILPEITLVTIERAKTNDPSNWAALGYQYRHTLRSLAYDPVLFERAACLLAETAISPSNERHEGEVSDVFASLFTIYLSGTHATIIQRLALIGQLIHSGDPKRIALGIKALRNALQTTHFVSGYGFEFGARSRDYGFEPSTQAEVANWFKAVLQFIDRSVAEGVCAEELRELVGTSFRGLWGHTPIHDQLEEIARKFLRSKYWAAGWLGCRQTLHFDKGGMPENLKSRLEALEAELRPSSVIEQVQSLVLGRRHGGLDFEDTELDEDVEGSYQRLEKKAERLGEICATDITHLQNILPSLFRGEGRLWSFGRGLAKGAHDPRGFWEWLCKSFAAAPPVDRNAMILCAYLSSAYTPHHEIIQEILDDALDDNVLGPIFPILQAAVPFDSLGLERLKTSLAREAAAVWTYGQLAYGRATEMATGAELRELISLIADKPDGVDVAIKILQMRLFADRTDKREISPELLLAGADILRKVTFRRNGRNDDYRLAELVRTCLADEGHRLVAAEIVVRLKSAIQDHQAAAYDYDSMLSALLERHSVCILDAIFPDTEVNPRAGLNVFDYLHEHQKNPADAIPADALVAWCGAGDQKRFLIAANFVTFGSQENAEEPMKWSTHAQALIQHAPMPELVLKELMCRFKPMSWSGSRAAIIEKNAILLDDYSVLTTSELQKLAAETKTELLRYASKEREWENARDKERNERFE